ncbi:bifunctional apoptosis regulator-like isoform X2 [Carassius carassius]|uniref:bifunctional apoptosis regulator-like isoform X2 n=1 Tax=Carassius carassius TaxID=217509 RepID=UPI002868E198|nr:bifunctional apoptosis regulator-like isoform X2 [Carassius carassius]
MDVQIPVEPELSESESEEGTALSESEFTCHCCYQVLVDPTTLTCGHSFCRHCLANWWASALPRVRRDCPECRAVWTGFPKVNILLRDAVEKLFPADVNRRKQAILSDPGFCRVLQMFQQHGNTQAPHAAPPQNPPPINIGEFYSGVVTALTFMTMVVLLYRAFSTDSSHEVLLSKPLSRWSADDVTLWVEHLGIWTNQYKETFHREQINGRLLFALSDDDLSAAPFNIRNESHRQIILEELHRLRQRRVSLNLWQYKDLNLGKTLFLLLSLRRFPRLTLLCLFLFDYEDTFLPFIHTSCPAQSTQDNLLDTPLDWPGWHQWAEFLLMYFLLPYQLLSAVAWHWMSVHYWTARVVMLHTVLLSTLDVHYFWTLFKRGQMRTLPRCVWQEVFRVMMEESLFVLMWSLIPQFFCNCLFYYNLYICPFNTAALVKRTLLQTDTQQRRI